MKGEIWQDPKDGEVIKMISENDAVVIVASNRYSIDDDIRGLGYVIKDFYFRDQYNQIQGIQ